MQRLDWFEKLGEGEAGLGLGRVLLGLLVLEELLQHRVFVLVLLLILITLLIIISFGRGNIMVSFGREALL